MDTFLLVVVILTYVCLIPRVQYAVNFWIFKLIEKLRDFLDA